MIQSTKIHQKMGTAVAGVWISLPQTKPHIKSEVKKGVHTNYTEEVTTYPQTSENTALHNKSKSPL